MRVEVRRARPDELERCLAIRYSIFVAEQGVPKELERDGLDPQCIHVVALVEETPVGTGRLRSPTRGLAKAERVCVQSAFRGQKLGARLMRTLEAVAREEGYHMIFLSAQAAAVPFYERLGYQAEGEAFEEAGLPHLGMQKALT